MDFRNEIKHEISYVDRLALHARLSAVMQTDPHAVNGLYYIRSLYFDNAYDKALREKIDGIDFREKFRIRYYNGDTSFIMLEKKCKIRGLCAKLQQRISYEDAQKIASGTWEDMHPDPDTLLGELIRQMRTLGLRPRTIVDYTREPFIFTPGNVRVTLDTDIRTGLSCTDFLNTDCVTLPVPENPQLLEVKWDEYLPEIIQNIVQIPSLRGTSFSKYAACRSYE